MPIDMRNPDVAATVTAAMSRVETGRSIDPDSWKPLEMTHGPSLWGHERAWIPADQLAQARDMRVRAALEGQRQPVQVIEGNYTLAPGTCPWWDATRKAGGS